MFEEWLPEAGDAARRTRDASVAAKAKGRVERTTPRDGRMRRAEDEGFLRERVNDLLHDTAGLLERVALVEQEILRVGDETALNDRPGDNLTATQGALAELHERNPAAFAQAVAFAEILLRVTQETERASSTVLGETNGAAKLTNEAVRSIRRRHPMGESMAALAREYGVCYGTIKDVVRRRTWKQVGREDRDRRDGK